MSAPCTASLRCSLDGSEIIPEFEVIIIKDNNEKNHFSCLSSAKIFLAESSILFSDILVTDEITGEKINAKNAFFVESEKITTPHTGNRIHVFADRLAAGLHAEKFNGKFIEYSFNTPHKKPAVIIKAKAGINTDAGIFTQISKKPLLKENIFSWIYIPASQHFYHKPTLILSAGYFELPYKPPQHFL